MLVRDATARADGGAGEIELDFSGVRRVGVGAVTALAELGAKGLRVVVRGAGVEVYKALKVAGVRGLEFGG